MLKRGSDKKVVALTERRRRNALKSKEVGRSNTRVMAITSGKGGVGKTNIVANLGFALSKLGKRVYIVDADLGLGNIDILLGIAPKYNLAHVMRGLKTIEEITVEGPGRVNILPASSGIQELTQLTEGEQVDIFQKLEALTDGIDILLFDTAAGISSNVLHFNAAAQEIMVVVSPEPTSVTDAYALMKVLSIKHSARSFKLVVNLASSQDEAYDVFRQLTLVTDRFLDIKIEYVGYILFDENVTRSVKLQRVVSEVFPHTEASKCFYSLAKKICESPMPPRQRGDSVFLWRRLLADR
ncbi:MAG: MinD/ParA family protein [Deltaproteobacteria bacterium]|nr:MinD/ParA family protein [Deltaproteobacteria bacterium]